MFVEVFNDLLAENDMSKKKFSEQSGIPYPTIIGWTNLHRLPDYTALLKIADFFHCSVDYLMGRENSYNDPQPAQIILSPKERELIALYRKLDPDGKQLIGKLADKLGSA